MQITDELINTSNDIIKINLNIPNLEQLKIIKKEQIPFKEGDIIVKYKLKGKEIPENIKSPIYGWILKYSEDDKILILEKCKHDIFYLNVCTRCLYKKTEKEKEELKSYGFTNSEFTFSKQKAESLEKSFVDDYLTSKKLILLLDLDNTILHCAPIIIPKAKKEALKKYNSYFAEIPIMNNIYKKAIILIKFRPYLKTFLSNIKKKYQIFIYTQATKEYATRIIQYINTNIENDSLSTSRLLTREEDENGFAKNKSIKNVFPNEENMILIIDDHTEVWKESGNNFICIYPYHFFSEEDKKSGNLIFYNSNLEKQKTTEFFLKADYDNVLFCITNLLLYVHRKFYKIYEKLQIRKNISRITNDTLKLIFFQKKFYYHINFFNSSNFFGKKKKKKNTKNKNNNDIIPKNEENKEEKDVKETDNKLDNNKDNDENMKIEENKEIKNEMGNNAKITKEEIENLKNNIKYKIEKLGGELILEENDRFNADIFLIDFYDINDPIIKSIEEYKDKKIQILHCHYIEICLMYFYAVNTEDFVLSEKNQYLKILDLNKIFEKNKADLIKFYENEDFEDVN